MFIRSPIYAQFLIYCLIFLREILKNLVVNNKFITVIEGIKKFLLQLLRIYLKSILHFENFIIFWTMLYFKLTLIKKIAEFKFMLHNLFLDLFFITQIVINIFRAQKDKSFLISLMSVLLIFFFILVLYHQWQYLFILTEKTTLQQLFMNLIHSVLIEAEYIFLSLVINFLRDSF